ncbi:hypothetical protein [Clostridium kluyveri]|uniref:Uncharacterized protein n=1 Tax=Clostridium kluyveri TaxID=1534 RepID=A0A1L5FEI3_CLOKL|nr:hypothetical protein [Clostridium kluyveri]APM41416.1 hypothetical protein BS101_22190 [Clostridium kluyveri]
MYKYMYPPLETTPPMCCYCMMANRTMYPPVMCKEPKPLFKGEEKFKENKINKGSTMPSMEKKPGMKQEMPDMMDMSKKDMEKMKSDVQEIVMMFEQHHPDILKTLTNCGMSINQAREYLSRIVGMSLMHHMMHQV